MRFSIPLPEGELLASGLNFRHAVAVSPDGRWLAYGSCKPGEGEQPDGDPIVNLRRVDQSEVRRIPGYNPFFSPDSLHLGFMTRESDGICSLRRAPVEGGLGERIVEFPSDLGFGCTWLPNGMIVFAPREGGGLYAVPSAGGQARPLTRLDTDRDEFSHRLPTALPGSNTLLYTVVRYEGNPDWETSRICALNLDSWETTVLLEGGSDCRFADSGHLLFARQGSLMAVGFNHRELEVMDEPVPVAQGMVHGTNVGRSYSETGAAQYGFSRAGLLLIAPGSTHPEPRRQIVWADGKGRETRLEVEPRRWVSAGISADGTQVLISSSTHPRAVWLFELERRTVLRQTFTGSPLAAVWGPDPNVFTMMAGPQGPMGIWTKPANSGTDPGPELALGPGPWSAVIRHPSSWSPDGRWLAFVSVSPETAHDIWIFDRQGSSFPFQQTTYRERYPEFSPDGRWLAYTSDESGRNEVYVRPFPATGAPVQVSTGGGEEPCWSKDGTLIFYSYSEPGETVRSYTSVRIETAGGSVKPGLPRRLFEAHSAFASPVRSYDVAPDGRFLLIKTDPDLGARRRKALAQSQLEVVTNWFTELEAKVPVE